MLAEPGHDLGGERPSFAGLHSSAVQFDGDLTHGVAIEQPIDFTDHSGIRFAGFSCGHGFRDVQGSDGAAFQTHLSLNLPALDQRHVVDEQAEHPLSFLIWSVRVAPDLGEVAC